MEDVKISVLIPVYNGEEYISECIDSILRNDFDSFEVVIVDDGSTDSTLEKISNFNDDRIRIIQKRHTGIADTLNVGILSCVGKYIVRIDADDIMMKNRLKIQFNCMENNSEIDIAGFGMLYMKDNNIIGVYQPKDDRMTAEILSKRNEVAHPTVIMRRESILSLPEYYNPEYACEDTRLWSVAIMNGMNISLFKTPVTIYRMHDNQLTVKNKEKIFSDYKVVMRNMDKFLNNENGEWN